ncbi:hypothetical protein [Glycomyces tritici]|uniref:Uncharacterized protein n=1 Tax=Glycomyces tritici TaxID=2665176 RepID=A0ABT7YJ05_9ACTN|nr:hypothetical protein [Glycomyces tritici]MDN3238590.1 hypothetical protein [Glycomyces tritici]
MTPEHQGAQPHESPAPPPVTPDPAPQGPQPDAEVRNPVQASPSVFESEADATVKVVPGAVPQPAPQAAPAPSPSPAPQSAFAPSNDDFLTEAQPSAAPRPADLPGYPPAQAPASSTGAMPQTTLPSPAAPPAQGYAMTPPPMGSPAGPPQMGAPAGPPPMGSPAGPPPGMQTGPMPLPPAPRKPRNKAAVAFGVIAFVLLAATATFGILYSQKANDFTEQAEELESVEEQRDALDAEKAELEDEIVALQLERDNLQGDSEARQACSDALDILIADEYPGTIDDLEDLASAEYMEWAQAHDELYREVERQCLA